MNIDNLDTLCRNVNSAAAEFNANPSNYKLGVEFRKATTDLGNYLFKLRQESKTEFKATKKAPAQ